MRVGTVLTLWILASALARPSFGQELTDEQMGPWSALEKQIKLAVGKEYEKEKEYIHSKAIFGGDDLPSPVTAARYEAYNKAFWENSEPVESYVLIPVTVTVVDNVAIINAYVKALVKEEDDEVEEKAFRLHNTWIKSDGRWQLLATYNASLSEDD
jgi:hypothetical protein